jgi:hypothetical protein
VSEVVPVLPDGESGEKGRGYAEDYSCWAGSLCGTDVSDSGAGCRAIG